MYKYIEYIVFTFILLLMGGCGSSYKLDQKAPFTISDPYVRQSPSSASVTEVCISVDTASPQLDSIYFQGQKAKLERIEDDSDYVAQFRNSTSKDLVMSNDPAKEYQNELPSLTTKSLPFDLKSDECVVSYKKESGKTGYFKVTGLEKK